MNYKRILQLLTLLLVTSTAFSQDYKLGKVTLAELEEKFHPIDSSASAAVLFKKGHAKFDITSDGNWTVFYETAYKIKIYNKEGFFLADQSFPHYVGGTSTESVTIYDAATYNLVDGKIEKTKLKSDGEFKENINENWRVKKITFPQVKEGSILEFTVKKTSPFISSLDDFRFQTVIPTNHAEFVIEIPKYFNYRTVISGYEKIDVKNYIDRHIYSGNNISALKDEDFTINKDNYSAILKLELASVSYPGKPMENRALDWDGVVKGIYDSDRFGSELKKEDYFKDDIDQILKDATSTEEKIAKIYYFVKNKMTWNEKYGIFTNDGVRKAYKQNQGNVAEINLMLIAMLKYAKIETNPVLISTRSNGIAVFPNRTAFNYVVAGVELQDQLLFLDATNNYNSVGQLPLRALNWVGRLIRNYGSSVEVNLLNVNHSKDNFTVLGEINTDGSLKGKARSQKTNYYAYNYRNNYSNVSKENLIERLEKKFNEIEVADYNADNVKEIEKPIIETFSFEDRNSVDVIGNKMYFSPFYFCKEDNNAFKSEKRNYPIDFNYPINDTYNFTIKIPEGYEVEFLPEPVQIETVNNYAAFRFNIVANGNQIQVISNFDINTFIVPSHDYEALRSFYQMMLKKHAEKIVLRKKA